MNWREWSQTLEAIFPETDAESRWMMAVVAANAEKELRRAAEHPPPSPPRARNVSAMAADGAGQKVNSPHHCMRTSFLSTPMRGHDEQSPRPLADHRTAGALVPGARKTMQLMMQIPPCPQTSWGGCCCALPVRRHGAQAIVLPHAWRLPPVGTLRKAGSAAMTLLDLIRGLRSGGFATATPATHGVKKAV